MMLTDLQRARVSAARVGRLVTVSPAGLPRAVPCCFVLLGDRAYTAVDGKPKRSAGTGVLGRVRDVATHPEVALLVDHYDEDWSALWWVRLDGTARVLGPGPEADTAVAALRAKYAQYAVVPIPGPVIALDLTGGRSWP